MSGSLQDVVSKLELRLSELERQRSSDVFFNDLYEAAFYWCELGRWVLERNTKINYPERVRGERELLTKLETILRGKPEEAQLKYGPLLSAGGELLRTVGGVQPPKDGHLGFLRIVRECFLFVETEFAFSVAQEQPTSLRLSSGAVYLELQYSRDPWMSCLFGPESTERKHFSIQDLLFLHGDQRYRTIPQKLTMNTEGEVEEWFRFVAGTFREYGGEILSNKPGIFDHLMQAQAQRDAEFVAAMNQKYDEHQ